VSVSLFMYERMRYATNRSRHIAGASILGVWGSQPPDFGQVGRGVAGRSWGCGRVVKNYYTLLCTGSMFKSGDF